MTRPDNTDRGSENPKRTSKAPATVFTVVSEELLRGGREMRILHGDEVYRLLVTRNDKLILQK